MRERTADKAIEMRRQGFVGACMLPMAELEYTGLVDMLTGLDARFVVREAAPKAES